MLKLKWALGAIGAVVLLGSVGCALDVPVPTDLTEEEIDDLLDCQDRIRREGQKFVKEKLRQLEKCSIELLEVQLLAENGQIEDPAELEEAIADAMDECDENFEEVAEAQQELIDDVADDCEDVEDVMLGDAASDPLGFQTLADSFDGRTLQDAEDLGALHCQVKELFVDLLVPLQVPRLGDGFSFGLERDPITWETLIAGVEEFGDPRCSVADLQL